MNSSPKDDDDDEVEDLNGKSCISCIDTCRIHPSQHECSQLSDLQEVPQLPEPEPQPAARRPANKKMPRPPWHREKDSHVLLSGFTPMQRCMNFFPRPSSCEKGVLFA